MRRRRIIPALVALVFALVAAEAQELTLGVDVPSDLGATTILGNQTARWSSGGWSLDFDGAAAGLTPDVNLDALEQLTTGGVLFSADAPFEVDGSTYEPRDVVRHEQGIFSLHVDGATLGLPASADIDALARDAAGDLLLSLDAPTTVGLATFAPGDVLRVHDGALTLLVSAAAMGLPAGTDVVGLDRTDDGTLYLQFDEPVTLGGTTYRPGDVVEYVDPGFALYFRDAAFPAGSVATDFSFPGSPGEVVDLLVARDGAQLDLSWGAGCGAAADYAVYEGAIGDWANRTPRTCSTNGATAATIGPDAGDRYFLVVPLNGTFEGSYGRDSTGAERAAAAAACVGQRRARACE